VGNEVFELPRLRALLRHAAPRILEGMVLPLVVFALALHLLGVTGAVVAGLVSSYLVVARHLIGSGRVPGVVILGAVVLTARSVLTLVTGSTLVYFLQPTLGTMLVGFAFLGSVAIGRPLAQRLAHDFCPIPDGVMANEHVRTFFLRISLLWAFVQLLNAGLTLWLMFSESIGLFVVLRSVVSIGLTGAAIAVSATWFVRSMRRHGVLPSRVPVAVAQGCSYAFRSASISSER
jgi:intracellular septation protein A